MPRSIKVDDETYEWLQHHKLQTGVPIQKTIHDSVKFFLDAIKPATDIVANAIKTTSTPSPLNYVQRFGRGHRCLCIVGCSVNGECPLHGKEAVR